MKVSDYIVSISVFGRPVLRHEARTFVDYLNRLSLRVAALTLLSLKDLTLMVIDDMSFRDTFFPHYLVLLFELLVCQSLDVLDY